MSDCNQWLILIIIIYTYFRVCFGLIWALRDFDEYLFATLGLRMFYIFWYLFAAAKASDRCYSISKMLQLIGNSHQKMMYRTEDANFSKIIAVYEINSGCVSVACKDIFAITYGFIAGVQLYFFIHCLFK